MINYNEMYDRYYFYRKDNNNSFNENRLRFGDQFPCIIYTFNISLLEVFDHIILRQVSVRDFSFDLPIFTPAIDQFRFIQEILNERKCRNPKSILEIGSGRGEITAFLNYCKQEIKSCQYQIQSLDVSPDFYSMYKDTCNRLFNQDLSQELMCGTLQDKYKEIDYSTVDTVILSEVLEHLHEEEFWKFFYYALPYFKKNNTRLIICNSWGYWPIEKNGWDHIWAIDDNVYDKIVKESRSVIVRSRSHLVIEF